MATRFRGDFRQSPGSAALQRQASHLKFNTGRQFVSDRVGPIDAMAEQIGLFINGLLRRSVPTIKQRIITERLSAPHIKIGRGKFLQKNPLSKGLRMISGDLQRSLRLTVTTPGTSAHRFRGVFRISAKIGGGKVQYAHRHENSGRMQFGRVTSEEWGKLKLEIAQGLQPIVAPFGGKASF